MRRLFQILKIGGLDVNDDECLNSEYEDESLASEQLEISLEPVFWNVQAYRQPNRILVLRERWGGRPYGGKMS